MPGGSSVAPWRRPVQSVKGAMAAVGERYRNAPRGVRIGLNVAFVALAALLPTILPYVTANYAYYTQILTKIGIAALLALGLNVVVGFAGLLDLGYVAFFAVGAYAFAVLSGSASRAVAVFAHPSGPFPPAPVWHQYFWFFFFLALGIAVLSGVLLGAPTLRLRGDYLAIVTLGFGEIVRITANNLDSFDNGAQGVNDIPHPVIALGGLHYDFGVSNPPYYYLLLGIIVLWIFLLRRLNDSRVGRAWAAIREDELAAAAMGIPTVRMKLLAFAMGAAVASLGGVIYASQIAFISPDTFTLFNVDFGSVIILSMVVLGGMGGIAGPILGAALIIFLPEQLRFLSDARLLVFGAVLVVMMIIRPQGLVPSRRRAAELTGAEVHDASVYEVQEHAR
ncbi:MAG: branched-chain amino acid ABC transporter permease [Actinomycetota bacterium]